MSVTVSASSPTHALRLIGSNAHKSALDFRLVRPIYRAVLALWGYECGFSSVGLDVGSSLVGSLLCGDKNMVLYAICYLLCVVVV